MTLKQHLKYAALATAFVTFGALAGCAPQQVATVEGLCHDAMSLAPLAGPVAPWIVGGCGTADAVASLAADPSSVVWLFDILTGVKKNIGN